MNPARESDGEEKRKAMTIRVRAVPDSGCELRTSADASAVKLSITQPPPPPPPEDSRRRDVMLEGLETITFWLPQHTAALTAS